MWRLGLKLGPNYIGYAGVEIEPATDWIEPYRVVGLMHHPKPPITGRETFSPKATFDEKVAHAVRAYEREAARYGLSEVSVKRYTKRSFRRSRAAREGGTLAEHDRLAEAVAAGLEALNISVVWDLVE